MHIILALALLSSAPETPAALQNVHLSPGAHLMQGEQDLGYRRYDHALYHFQQAIASNALNDAGMSMAYWNVYVCGRSLHRMDVMAIGLVGFITYATSFVEQNDVTANRWAKEFKIKGRLGYSKSKLDALWAEHNPYTCRTPMYPCYLSNPVLLKFYFMAIGFCNNNLVFSENNTRAVAHCPDGTTETYYFYHEQ